MWLLTTMLTFLQCKTFMACISLNPQPQGPWNSLHTWIKPVQSSVAYFSQPEWMILLVHTKPVNSMKDEVKQNQSIVNTTEDHSTRYNQSDKYWIFSKPFVHSFSLLACSHLSWCLHVERMAWGQVSLRQLSAHVAEGVLFPDKEQKRDDIDWNDFPHLAY